MASIKTSPFNNGQGFCYGCLNLKPLTQDHIIPQAIGGKLKVPLCVNCHEKVYPIDTALIRGLHQFATLLNVKRGRKKHKPFRVKQVSTGDEFNIDSNSARRAHPIVKINYDHEGRPAPDVRAPSRESLLKILNGIEKKLGHFSQQVEIRTEPTSLGMIEYEITVGGRLFMRSVAKSAYLMLASRLPAEKVSSSLFEPVREFIFEDKGTALTSFNFVHTEFMSRSRGPLHGIAIHFDSQKRNIVGYVQYFGIFRFSVLIAQGIPWRIDMADLKYCLDPISRHEVPLKFLFTLPDVKSEDCLRPLQTTEFVHSEIAKGLRRLKEYCNSMGEAQIEFINH